MIHLFVWRLKLPRRQIKALLITFVVVGGIWSLGAVALRVGILPILHTGLFYGVVSLCYVITYSAIEGDSPTLSLVLFVAEAETRGRSKTELDEFMVHRPFVRARLSALVLSDFIREKDGRFFATGHNPLPFRIILGFRKLYGPIARGG